MGGQGSLMHMGSEGWSGWSDMGGRIQKVEVHRKMYHKRTML